MRYTRYADDLTISAVAGGPAHKAPWIQKVVTSIVEGSKKQGIKGEGFRVHPTKSKTMGRGDRQEVTGLVVNEDMGFEYLLKSKICYALPFTIKNRGKLSTKMRV